MSPALYRAIVAMSACAVVSDAVLIAFYPQFFAQRYGVHSTVHVGSYVAAISVAVMCTLPLWARLARHVDTLRLLLWTQGAAGALCLASAWAGSVAGYWVLSMLMFMCKSSYLLLYPYLMRRLPAAQHGHVIGLLSVVVHAGSIAGAVLGGATLQHLGAQAGVALMAGGDFAMMALCAWLIRSGHAAGVAAPEAAAPARAAARPRRPVLTLCALVMLVDFSAYLVRPFFTRHWEALTGSADQWASGAAFAVPGAMALLALLVNQRARQRQRPLQDALVANLLLGAAGLLLQAAPLPWLVLAGRALYGWAMFQLIVKLEVLLFRFSAPADYARDFSLFNFFQNLGVLLASFAAGWLVQSLGAGPGFAVAALGFALAALLERGAFRLDRPAAAPLRAAPTAAEASHAG